MKAALVTGGGTGIGAAVARRLAADGYAVTVTGRRPGPIEEIAREIDGHAVTVSPPATAPTRPAHRIGRPLTRLLST